MCCSLHQSAMSDTILYAAATERDGNLVHVMAYQNQARNLAAGPNAMILPCSVGITAFGGQYGRHTELQAGLGVLRANL